MLRECKKIKPLKEMHSDNFFAHGLRIVQSKSAHVQKFKKYREKTSCVTIFAYIRRFAPVPFCPLSLLYTFAP
ncbi:MAG TPA: hypothetical protein DDX98_03615 [Bacteroidales bacterium]|nr:hypothetical protein [Bacteroidales bacterium]